MTKKDKLRDCGIEKVIKLPRIAVLGSQSAGKSSVLESIVGIDFLPRGEGIVTRRPLELRLNHLSFAEAKPWGIFDEIPDEKFYDFNVVKQKIDELTDKVAGKGKNVVDEPIILNIYSATCPDLTLIDLPGITKIAIGGQDEEIEAITKNLGRKYCDDERTIILAVIAANMDMTLSDGLHLARKIDPEGLRTLGVITKIDIMNPGSDAKKMLLGQEVPLNHGYVGVRNRSQIEMKNKMTIKEALAKETQFFSTHPIYGQLNNKYWGTGSLIKNLTKTLFKQIKNFLPTINIEISSKLKETEEKIKSLGTEIPKDSLQRMNLVWQLIQEFSETCKHVLGGYYDSKKTNDLNNLSGHQIKEEFKNLLKDFVGSYAATDRYSVNS